MKEPDGKSSDHQSSKEKRRNAIIKQDAANNLECKGKKIKQKNRNKEKMLIKCKVISKKKGAWKHIMERYHMY